MKNFIKKSSIFVLPFILFYVITISFYSPNQNPDLLRIGYFPNIFRQYQNDFKDEYDKKIYYKNLSEVRESDAEVFIIGDSFSSQGSSGFVNYLAENLNVLYSDRLSSETPIQGLFQLANGDFFNDTKIKYVVLENVERFFTHDGENVDVSKVLLRREVDSIISINHKPAKEVSTVFFSKRTLLFPITMSRYFLQNNYLSNDLVFNVELTSNSLFSNNIPKLLFTVQDFDQLGMTNDLDKVRNLNFKLNLLAQKLDKKNIILIVLPAPDKYDFYYDYIKDKTNFPRPLFFNHLRNMNKKYMYIDAKKALSKHRNTVKDIYYFDDTHWSPNGSRIIASEVHRVILKDKLGARQNY